ncbi:phosphotransferase [Cellulomonas sp. HZM]|uniref:phosphotransferase n=1 Tax=Cellulomonas sp. HZM TaxID=1454010 RepID=UPI000A4CE3AF|nr:phosphotransferase [Cellulomonas sp. HZM]
MTEIPLPGGNVGGAVRVGDTVRRPTGPWTPAVHELLTFLTDAGLPHVPRVLGIDEQGREVLTYLHGDVVPIGRRALTDGQLASAARWLATFHEVVAGFPCRVRRWRFVEADVTDGEIVCHQDFAMYNLAFEGDELAGVFDWDVAGPGLPIDDLAILAWNSPLLDLGTDPAAAAHGLRVVADAYGGPGADDILDRVFVRMTLAARRIRGGQAAGDPGMLRLGEIGEPASTERRLAELEARRPQVEHALGRP